MDKREKSVYLSEIEFSGLKPVCANSLGRSAVSGIVR